MRKAAPCLLLAAVTACSGLRPRHEVVQPPSNPSSTELHSRSGADAPSADGRLLLVVAGLALVVVTALVVSSGVSPGGHAGPHQAAHAVAGR